MTIEAKLPDGTILKFPAGTDPDVIRNTVRRRLGVSEQSAPEEIEPSPGVVAEKQSPGLVSGAGQAALQGATFGFSDEIEAAIAAGFAKTFGGKATESESFAKLMDEARKSLRADSAAFAKENPEVALGATIAGGLATGKPAFGLLKKAGVATQGARGVAATGASFGAVAGAGTADDGEVLQGAATGAALGAGIGLSVSGLGLGLGAVWTRLKPDVQTLFAKMARDSGLTPAQVQTRLSALGPKAVLADVSKVFGRAADTAASRIGPVATKAEKLIRRDETQFGRLIEPIRRSLGGTGKNVSTANQLKDIRMQESSPLYERAFDAGVQMTNRMRDLLNRPETQKAWRAARTIGKSDPNVDVVLLGKGDPSFRGWQAITEQLYDRSRSLARADKNKFANTIRDLRNAILDELDAQSPDYKKARALWAGTKQADDMLEEGSKILKSSPAEIREAWRTMSEADKAFYRLGAGRTLEERLATSNDTIDLGRIFRNEALREKAHIIFPDKKSAVDFINTVRAETIKKTTSNFVGKGSDTFARQQSNKQLGGAAIGAESTTLTGLARRGVQALNIGGARESTIQDLGLRLLSDNPAVQQSTIRMMAPPGGNALLRLRPGPIGAAAANVGTQRLNR